MEAAVAGARVRQSRVLCATATSTRDDDASDPCARGAFDASECCDRQLHVSTADPLATDSERPRWSVLADRPPPHDSRAVRVLVVLS